jgi:hypothetical protein
MLCNWRRITLAWLAEFGGLLALSGGLSDAVENALRLWMIAKGPEGVMHNPGGMIAWVASVATTLKFSLVSASAAPLGLL